MDAVYPARLARLARGRRRRGDPRHRTTPVTFAEIKEVDEEKEECEEAQAAQTASARSVAGDACSPELHAVEHRLGREFAEFRRRRARPEAPRDLDVPRDPDDLAALAPSRASSEPRPDVGAGPS